MENSTVKHLLTILACLWSSVVYADQNSIVVPETGSAWDAAHPATPPLPHTFENTAKFFINPALRSMTSNFSGTGCGGITSPVPWQWCVDSVGRKVYMNTSPSGGSPFSFTPAFSINADGTLSPGPTSNSYLLSNNPTFTGEAASNSVGGFAGNYMFLQGPSNSLYWYLGGAGVNGKEWAVYPDSTKLHFSLDDDSQFHINDWMTVKRSGTTVSNVDLAKITTASSGLVCDNVTDDGPALQAAMTASQYYWITLPANAQCRIKSFVSIPSHTYLRGQNTTFNLDPAATHGGSLDVTVIMDSVSDIRIEGVTFNGAGSSTPSPNHSRVAGVSVNGITVRNSAFTNFGDITSHTTAVNTYTHGLQIFNVVDGYFENSLYQNNSGDGLSLSNANNRVWIRGNRAINNYDSGIIPCTIGGTYIYTTENYVSVSSTDIPGVPGIGLDRCSNAVVANNWIDAPALTNCIRVARYGDTAQINKDLHIRGNTCTGGSNISVEALGPTQGSQTLTKGGYWSVVDNTVIGASGQSSIHIVDSQNGQVIGNRVISGSAEGIIEESFGTAVGGNIISGNIVDGATYCFRQLASGGSVINSTWSNNVAKNCSTASTAFTANLGTDGIATVSCAAGFSATTGRATRGLVTAC